MSSKFVFVSLFLALLTFGCSNNSVSVQIGGTKNTSEQNRQPASSVQPAQPSPTPQEQQSPEETLAVEEEPVDQESQEPTAADEATAEWTAERQRIATEQQTVAEETALEAQRRALAEQTAERIRIETQNLQAERQRRLLEQANSEQLRLAEQQRSASTQPQPHQQVYAPPTNEVFNRAIREGKRIGSGPLAVQVSGFEEQKKKGHSTRNKIIAGTAIAGGAAVGIWLWKRR